MQRGREGFLEGFILPFKASEISSCNSLTAFPTAYKPFELEGPAFIIFQPYSFGERCLTPRSSVLSGQSCDTLFHSESLLQNLPWAFTCSASFDLTVTSKEVGCCHGSWSTDVSAETGDPAAVMQLVSGPGTHCLPWCTWRMSRR